MSSPNPGDLLLVNRDGVNYQIDYNDMSTLQDTDLLLVNRGGTNYQLAAVDLDLKSGSIGSPVEVLTPVDGAGVGGAFNYTAVSDTITAKGPLNKIMGVIDQSILGEDPERIEDLSYGNGRYIVITEGPGSNYNQVVRYSDDNGYSWQQTAFPQIGEVRSLIHNGVNFVAVGGDDIVYSPDGIAWNNAGGDISDYIEELACDPVSGRICAVGNYLNYSATRHSAYSYSNGHSSVIYSNDNGATWIKPSLTSGSNGTVNVAYHEHRRIGYGNGIWVVGAYGSNSAMYSSDGMTWYSAGTDAYGSYSYKTPIVYDDQANQFMQIVTHGNDTRLLTSLNGQSWNVGYIHQNNNQQSGWSRYDSMAYGDGNVLTGFQKSTTDDYYFAIFNDAGVWNTQYMYWYRPSSTYYYPAPRKVWYLNNQFIAMTNGRGDDLLIFFGPDNRPWQGTSQYGVVYNPSDLATAEVTLASENVYNDADGSLIAEVAFDEVFNSGYTELTDSIGGATSSNSHYIYNNSQISGNTYEIHSSIYNGVSVGSRIRKTTESTVYGPSSTEVEFTSENAGTTPVNASDATLAFRRWTLETRATSSDPWTVVVEADDYSPVASQDGATPWASKPTLSANTMYRVKVAYHSANAREVESDYVEFTTGDS